ncbi:MAG: VacB/RNase II family 3'-5' exoribonuclease, partial [Spirochaetes bacterium]|nr:VacB/RNase II family 3'-5' exoribonuclease [Spirochaetota bacterium]
MKITRDKIQKILKDHSIGIDYRSICNKMKALSVRRSEKVSRILKGLVKEGLIDKKFGKYVILTERTKLRKIKKEKLSPKGDFLRVAKKHNLPLSFPSEVLAYADRCSLGTKDEIKKRRFIEDWAITIDSETARDLDDAVSVVKKGFNYTLGVHISDVSWYVKKGSHLDKEALKRGTSVYLIDKVIPMFPPQLSNELCSLNADQAKLTFSAFMTISSKGEIRDFRIERTALKVNRRFSYKEVDAVLKGKSDPDKKKLRLMAKLAEILRNRRMKNGSLLFDIPEIKVMLDEESRPVSIDVPKRLESECIIEEFMLCANQNVAEYLNEAGPSIFRIHESPDEEKLSNFYQFASRMGLVMDQPSRPDAVSFQRILDNIKSNPAVNVLNSMLLRSMQRAEYSTRNPGHFGLAFTTYTHFTSPIRRYPDLIVHRLLDAAMRGKKGYAKKILQDMSHQSSKMEQAAVNAEREIVRIKGARFLQKYKGKPLKGRITSVVSWGMFLTLLPFGLDGMVHVNDLKDDRYDLDQFGHSLIGKRHGRQYRLGDVIDVSIKTVNIEKGMVDLVLV